MNAIYLNISISHWRVKTSPPLPSLPENLPCLAAGVGLVVGGGVVTTNWLQSPGVNRISSSAISPAYPRPLSASNTICNENKLDEKLH